MGYVLKRGFDLPPLMFTPDEVEAVVVGMRLVRRTGDPGLQQAAERVLSKVTIVLPRALRDHATSAPFYVSSSGAPAPAVVDTLKKRGARFRNEIVIGKGGKQILLDDPSGNAIELFEPPR